MALKEKEEVEKRKQAILREFEPLLEAIAAVARGEPRGREEIEAILPGLEENGWHIAEAVRRIWAGERDPAALTAGLDAMDTALVLRVLALLG